MDRRTNWNEYYNAPFFLAKYTRKYAETWLIRTMKKYFPSSGIKIAELGG
jgi:hypothetical protein